MSNPIDIELLEAYANTLLRHGRPGAPYWFVGVEEGGSDSVAEIAERLERWDRGGRQDVHYLAPYPGSKHLPDDGRRAHLQRTWANQLRVVLGITGEPLHNERVRELQTSAHGTEEGMTCLLELLPLPCPKTSDWLYGSLGLGEAFASKTTYRRSLLPARVAQILESARSQPGGPVSLVFMAWGHREALTPSLPALETLEIGFGKNPGRALIGVWENIVVAICSHPGDRFNGSRNDFFHRLGQEIGVRADAVGTRAPRQGKSEQEVRDRA